jgi:hypothetical protein
MTRCRATRGRHRDPAPHRLRRGLFPCTLKPNVQGVPTSEMLREAALHASWQRDRRVRARKLTWRWIEWFATRWMLPVAAALALGYVPAADWDQLPIRALVPPPEGMTLAPAIGAASATAPAPRIEPAAPRLSLQPELHFIPKEKR